MVKEKELPPGAKVAGYVRVSSVKQVEKGESLEVQEQLLREEAKRRGWRLVVYTEPGISAKDENRPEYQRLREALKTAKLDGLMVYKLDRLWRSKLARQLDEVEYVTQTCGKHLVSLTQHVDTSTAAGRLALNAILSVGAYERENLAERVTAVMLARAKAGRWNGSPVPYGFALAEDGRLVVEEAEAATVRTMFAEFLRCRTVRGVTHHLNNGGHRTRPGQPWPMQTVRRLLASPLYRGDLVYNRRDTSTGKAKARPTHQHIPKAGALPAIVDGETFAAAQAILTDKKGRTTYTQSEGYLLAGLVRCGRCGGTMSGHASFSKRKTGRVTYRYYRCSRYEQRGKIACPGESIRADTLEQQAVDILWDFRTDTDKLRQLQREQHQRLKDEVTPARREIAKLEGALTKLAAQEERITTGFVEGLLDKRQVQDQRARVQAKREQTEATLEAAKATLAEAEVKHFDVEAIVQALDDAHDVYENLDHQDRRALLRSFIREIVVRDGQATLALQSQEDGWFVKDGDGDGGSGILSTSEQTVARVGTPRIPPRNAPARRCRSNDTSPASRARSWIGLTFTLTCRPSDSGS